MPRRPKTPIPAERELCGGLLLGNRSGRRFGLGLSPRTLPRPPWFRRKYSNLRPGGLPPPMTGSSACAPAAATVALSTGCSRAHSWRSEASERRLLCFQMRRRRFRHPLDSFESPPTPLGEGSRPSPWRVPCHLAAQASYPGRGAFRCRFTSALGNSAGHSRVRFFLCERWHPLQAAFTPCDISLRGPHRYRLNSRYETPRPLFRFDPPAESSCDSSVSQSILLPTVRSRIESLVALRQFVFQSVAPSRKRPGSPEPADSFIVASLDRERKLFLKLS
jgi:hypothetical protein